MSLRKISAPVFITLLAFAAVSLSGCAFSKLARSEKLKPPVITYVTTEVKSVQADKAEVEFVLNAKNPNKIGLKNVSVDYELFHQGRKFLTGDKIIVNLKPAGDTKLRIPAEIPYVDVFMTAGAVTQRVLAGDKTVPVRIDAVISGNPTLYNEKESGSLFSFSVSLSRVVEIPLPVKKMDEAKDTAKKKAIKAVKRRY